MVNITYDSSGSLVSTDRNGKIYIYNPGDISWMLASTALVWIMIPGAAFFYSGFLRRRNALSMLYLSSMTFAVVTLQWFFLGFSLVYSDTGSYFLGDLRYACLKGVLDKPSIDTESIPSILYCVYQLMFAAFTPLMAIGAVAERARLGPLVVFVFVWSTVVYDPITYWIWNVRGWSARLGSLDFAGGTPVHITSGATALALSRYLGCRPGITIGGNNYPPNNISYIYLGTALMWFGWFGFTGGSALAANFKAASALIVTNVAASAGGLTYLILEYHQWKKWSTVAFCSGVIDGLVAITPGAGFVGAPAALAIGVVAAITCQNGYRIALWLRIDDALGIFQHHGVGGFVGNVLAGLFAQAGVAALDGDSVIKGGFPDHNYIQPVIQLVGPTASFAYAFVMTSIILWLMHCTEYLRLRLDKAIHSVDFTEMDESICDYRDDPDHGVVVNSDRHENGAAGNIQSQDMTPADGDGVPRLASQQI